MRHLLTTSTHNSTSYISSYRRSSGVFDDSDVIHTEGEVDPLRDIKIIHNELRLKDLEGVNKKLDHLDRTVAKGNDKARKFECVSSVLRNLILYRIKIAN